MHTRSINFGAFLTLHVSRHACHLLTNIQSRSVRANLKQFRSAHESSDKGASSYAVDASDSEDVAPLNAKLCTAGDTRHPPTMSTGDTSAVSSLSPSNASFRAKGSRKRQQEGLNNAMNNLQGDFGETASKPDAMDGLSRGQTHLSFGDMTDNTTAAAAVTAAATTTAFGQMVSSDKSVQNVHDGAARRKFCDGGLSYGFSCAAFEYAQSKGSSGACGAGCDGVARPQPPTSSVEGDDEQEALFGIEPGMKDFAVSAFDPARTVPGREDDHGTETTAGEPMAMCDQTAKRSLIWTRGDAAANVRKMSLTEQVWCYNFASCQEQLASSALVTAGCPGTSNGSRNAGAASVPSAPTVACSLMRQTPGDRVSSFFPNANASAAGDRDITPTHEIRKRGVAEAGDGSVRPLGATEISLEPEDMSVEDDWFRKALLEQAFGDPAYDIPQSWSELVATQYSTAE